MTSNINSQILLRTGRTWTALFVALLALLVVSLWSFEVAGYSIASLINDSGQPAVSQQLSSERPADENGKDVAFAQRLPVADEQLASQRQVAAEEQAQLEAQAKAEEQARLEAQAKAEQEQVLLEVQTKAEEQARLEAQAKAEQEQVLLEVQAKAEEQARLEAQAKAEQEQVLLEVQTKAEEQARLEAQAKAEQEQVLLEAQAKAEQEQARLEVQAKAQQERAQLEAQAKVESESGLQADANAETLADNADDGGELVSLNDELLVDTGVVKPPMGLGIRAAEIDSRDDVESATQTSIDNTDTLLASQEIAKEENLLAQPQEEPAEQSVGKLVEEPIVVSTAEQVTETQMPVDTRVQSAVLARGKSEYERTRDEELKILNGQSARIQFEPTSFAIDKDVERPLDRIFDPLFLYAEMPVVVAVSGNDFDRVVSNNVLSLDRGDAIVRYLVNRGLDEERFKVVINSGEELTSGTHRVLIYTEDPQQ